MDDVRVAEAVSHLAELRLRPPGQGEERHRRLGEAHVELAPATRLAGFHPHLGVGVGVDLAEEAQLDLAREETVLLSAKRAAPGLLHVRLGEVTDEVASDTHVEEELAGAALLVEREGLSRARQVRDGRARRRSPRRRRRGHGRQCGSGHRRGRRGPLSLELLQPVGDRLELLLERLELSAQRLGLLSGGGRGHQDDGQEREHQHASTHDGPPWRWRLSRPVWAGPRRTRATGGR